MSCDKDNDDSIDKKEAKELSLKISLALQAYDVGFDTAKFLKVVAKDPSVSGVIAVVLKLLPKDEKKEEDEKRHFDDASDSDEDSDDEDEDSELYGEFTFTYSEHLLHRRLLTFCHLIFADMFYMGVNTSSVASTGASVFSAGSGQGVSLMKTDRKRKSMMSASETLLGKRRMDRRLGTFGS